MRIDERLRSVLREIDDFQPAVTERDRSARHNAGSVGAARGHAGGHALDQAG
jgi:hypothetical protein